MRAVVFEGPGQVRVEERPEPSLTGDGDAIVRVESTAVCGSDLHIYHGRVRIEPGFIIGHEYVGTVIATGDAVSRVAVGDRVLGCFHTACGACFFCRRGLFHKCDHSRTFGHGEALGSLLGTQAEQALVPNADLVLRRVPDGMSDAVALFAGDVMGTAFHAVDDGHVRPGDTVAVIGLGPVGLCAVQVARAFGAAEVIGIDTVAERLELARSFGARPVHLHDGDPRAAVREHTGGRGADHCIDAVGSPEALDLAIRLARKGGSVEGIGVYAERMEVHMGLAWIKSLTIRGGQANVIAHVDRVLDLLTAGLLDPSPIVTRRMALDEAPEAYAVYDRREALKIVMTP
jgi:2-desacetyl-2-hydroxyethyl bacteriochlorophyllide A dehydrogenase